MESSTNFEEKTLHPQLPTLEEVKQQEHRLELESINERLEQAQKDAYELTRHAKQLLSVTKTSVEILEQSHRAIKQEADELRRIQAHIRRR